MQADPHKLDFRNELLACMPGAGGLGPLGPMGGGLPPSHDLTRPASLFTVAGVCVFGSRRQCIFLVMVWLFVFFAYFATEYFSVVITNGRNSCLSLYPPSCPALLIVCLHQCWLRESCFPLSWSPGGVHQSSSPFIPPSTPHSSFLNPVAHLGMLGCQKTHQWTVSVTISVTLNHPIRF